MAKQMNDRGCSRRVVVGGASAILVLGVSAFPARAQSFRDLRASGAYQVLRPEEAVEMIQKLGRDRTFILTPLLGGLDPTFAWKGLRLFEREVWPHVSDLRD